MRCAKAWWLVSVVPVILAGAGVVLSQANPSAFRGQTRLPSDGVYLEEQASHGDGVYRTACETCHGQTLEGSELAPPLQGKAFLEEWDGEVLAELMIFLQEAMPEDAPGSLSEETYLDLLAFVLATNGFPPGDELTMTSIEEIVITTED